MNLKEKLQAIDIKGQRRFGLAWRALPILNFLLV